MPHYLVPGETLVEREKHREEFISPVDGDFKKTEYIDTSDDGGRRIRNGDLLAGRALKPDNIPTQAKRVLHHAQGLSDLYVYNGVHFVSDRFKALVERFEPGVHQFFPMVVMQGKKQLGTLHYFNICNRIGGLAPDACFPPFKPEDRMYISSYTPADRIVTSARKTAGFHIWRDKYDFPAMISDAFAAAMVEEGLVGAKASDRLPEVE
jgi:hypothetical protein